MTRLVPFAAPEQIVLDIDTTDMAPHGTKKGPGFITATPVTTVTCRCTFSAAIMAVRAAAVQQLGAAVGSRKEVERIVQQIGSAGRKCDHPTRRLGDSVWTNSDLCEQNRVDFVLGMARKLALGRSGRGGSS